MKTCFLIIFSLIITLSVIDESFAETTIEMKLGQEIQVNDLNLNFHEIEDSRCPSDLTCI